MSYDSEVLADSPWIYLKTDEASGTIADSSGNGRNLTLPAGSPTYAQSGPAGASDALSWPDSAGATEYYGVTSATLGSATESIECWFYLTATPTNDTPLVGHGTWNNTGVRGFVAFIGTDGKMKLWVGDSSTATVFTSASAVGLNAWHHMVATVSGTNSKVRLDKTDVVTGTGQAFTAAALTFLLRGGGNRPATANLTNGSVVKVSKAASYSTALSNTRIDAHYNAMGVLGAPVTLDLAASLPVVEAAFTVDVTEPPATLALDANLPLTQAAFTVDYAPPPVTLTLDATLPTLAASFHVDTSREFVTLDATLPLTEAAFDLTYTPPPVTLDLAATLPTIQAAFSVETGVIDVTLAATLPLLAARFDVTYGGPYPTDTSNLFTGLNLGGLGYVTQSTPTVAAPAIDLGARVDAALPYPQPVMDNGRPT